MRQASGAIVCPECGKLISVSEPKCPYCGAWRPGLFGWAPQLQKLFGGRINFTSIVVSACIGLYVASLVLDPGAIFAHPEQMFQNLLFNFLAPSGRALYQLGMTGGIAWRAGWWWTLFTAIYLHGGLLHIFFNVMWIRNLGPAVDDVYGTARAFVIFSVAGAAGFLVSNLATGNPTIGASGSIFGLLGALIVYGRRTHHRVLTTQLWQWAIVMFALAFVMSSVNNWAHAGGFAGGWVAGEAMRFSEEKRETPWVQLLALALLLITLVGFVLSFYNVTMALLGR